MSLHELVYELLIVCSGKQGGVSRMNMKEDFAVQHYSVDPFW